MKKDTIEFEESNGAKKIHAPVVRRKIEQNVRHLPLKLAKECPNGWDFVQFSRVVVIAINEKRETGLR